MEYEGKMKHECLHEDDVKKISGISNLNKILIGLVALFLTIASMAMVKAESAETKAAEAKAAVAEMGVIKNDIKWIKEYLQKGKP